MRQKFGKWFILVPIGLFFLAGTIAITTFENMPDIVKGLLFGVGVGLIALPFIIKRIKPTSR